MTERTPEQEREIAIKRLVIFYKLCVDKSKKDKILRQINTLKKGRTNA